MVVDGAQTRCLAVLEVSSDEQLLYLIAIDANAPSMAMTNKLIKALPVMPVKDVPVSKVDEANENFTRFGRQFRKLICGDEWLPHLLRSYPMIFIQIPRIAAIPCAPALRAARICSHESPPMANTGIGRP